MGPPKKEPEREECKKVPNPAFPFWYEKKTNADKMHFSEYVCAIMINRRLKLFQITSLFLPHFRPLQNASTQQQGLTCCDRLHSSAHFQTIQIPVARPGRKEGRECPWPPSIKHPHPHRQANRLINAFSGASHRNFEALSKKHWPFSGTENSARHFGAVPKKKLAKPPKICPPTRGLSLDIGIRCT